MANGPVQDSTVTRKLDEVTAAITTFSATTLVELKGLNEKVSDLEGVVYKGGADGEGVTAQLKFIQKDIEQRNKRATEYSQSINKKLGDLKSDFTKALAASNDKHEAAIASIKNARAEEQAAADKKWEDHRKGMIKVLWSVIGAAVIGLLVAGFNAVLAAGKI